MSQIRVFRMIALAEGVSFLTLLFIAMPMKYFMGMPEVVRVVGSIHGVLFVLYVGLDSFYTTMVFHFFTVRTACVSDSVWDIYVGQTTSKERSINQSR